MRHKKVRARSNDKLSAGAWNDMIDWLNTGNSSVASQSRLPAILQGSTIVTGLSADGTAIGPFQPVRLRTPRNFINPLESMSIEVEAVTPEDSNYWTYGFTLNEGISGSGGGRVVVGGIAVVRMTREQYAGANVANAGRPWTGQWYNLPDDSICTSGEVMGPVGRFQAVSVWDEAPLIKQTSADDDYVYVAINLDSAPSQVIVETSEEVAASAGGSLYSTDSAKVLHGTVGSSAGTMTTDQLTDFEIIVYNPRQSAVAAGTHIAAWSAEFNCFFFADSGGVVSQLCGGGQETSWSDDFESYTDGQSLTPFGYGGGFYIPKAIHVGAGKHAATAVNVPDESYIRRQFQMDYNNHQKMIFEAKFISKDASFSDCRMGLWMGSPIKLISAFDWDASTITAIPYGAASGSSTVFTVSPGDVLKMEVTFSDTDSALIGTTTKCFVNGTEEHSQSSSNIVKTSLDWCTAYYGFELLNVSGTTTGLITDDWDFELTTA